MNAIYQVPELEWLQLSLDVMSLKDRGSGYVEDFEVSADGKIRCSIASTSANAMVDKNMAKSEQLYYYKTWFEAAKAKVEARVRRLPQMRATYDAEHDLVVEILYDYGKGAYRLCEFQNGEVKWHEHAK